MSGFGALGRAGMAAEPATVGYLDHPSPGRPTVPEATYDRPYQPVVRPKDR